VSAVKRPIEWRTVERTTQNAQKSKNGNRDFEIKWRVAKTPKMKLKIMETGKNGKKKSKGNGTEMQ
jgi:hypothetical protein